MPLELFPLLFQKNPRFVSQPTPDTFTHTKPDSWIPLCIQVGAYLADILTVEEANFIKGVLNAVNPKDGTDYFIGGLDDNRDKGVYWMTGQAMDFTDFKDKNEPAGLPYLHMNFDAQFKWDTKDDANDKDNGFICKKVHTA